MLNWHLHCRKSVGISLRFSQMFSLNLKLSSCFAHLLVDLKTPIESTLNIFLRWSGMEPRKVRMVPVCFSWFWYRLQDTPLILNEKATLRKASSFFNLFPS